MFWITFKLWAVRILVFILAFIALASDNPFRFLAYIAIGAFLGWMWSVSGQTYDEERYVLQVTEDIENGN